MGRGTRSPFFRALRELSTTHGQKGRPCVPRSGRAVIQTERSDRISAVETASAEASAADLALEAKLSTLPASPGVYLFKDKAGEVIYVGKAKSLRARVRQYARGGDGRAQIGFLLAQLADVEVLITNSEKEALLLENTLIKQYWPRYNIRLKDDKSYWSIKVTTQDPWPRLFLTRQVVKDGSKYLGPFHSSTAVQETLEIIRKVFPLRTCSDTVFRNRTRPCLEYQIKRCLGPCALPVDPEEYQRQLKGALLLLEGKNTELVDQLTARMQEAAEALRFEEAARLRDQIRAIIQTGEKQQVAMPLGNDQDIFGLYREGGFVEVQVLFVRAGKLVGNQGYGFDDNEFPDEEVLAELLTQFYQGDRFVPDEVILPVVLEDVEVREELLAERKGKKVTLLCPQRGDKVRLVEMAQENARQSFIEKRRGAEQKEKTLDSLRRALHLRNAPKRIECFDISNIQGNLAVGSMVVFDEGEPDKNRYRRFRIKTVEGADDFAMMYEVLTRRYRRALEEQDLPDLLMVDGGKGQLGVAVEVFRELGITEVDLIGLAKMRTERDPFAEEVAHSSERVFLPGRKNPIVLKPNSTALFLLQRVRDEAHRFAITYHRQLRARERLSSPLDAVPGVGPARRKALLRHFGSLKRVRAATVEELTQVAGVTPAMAEAIRRHLAGELQNLPAD
ncbi:MAG: excinuclease ABC subunit UvrC [Deltaproteobacteria bacterium]|nr:excinuclease ABC subunit UvrC [Deltaproteobacteria bacterium]